MDVSFSCKTTWQHRPDNEETRSTAQSYAFVGRNKTTQAQRVAAFPVYEPCRCRKRFLANARKALFQPTIKFTYFLTLSTERLVGSYQIPKK